MAGMGLDGEFRNGTPISDRHSAVCTKFLHNLVHAAPDRAVHDPTLSYLVQETRGGMQLAKAVRKRRHQALHRVRFWMIGVELVFALVAASTSSAAGGWVSVSASSVNQTTATQQMASPTDVEPADDVASAFAGWKLGVALLGVAVGSVVEGILGFGCSMVWLAVLSQFASVVTVVAILKPLTILMNLAILKSCWRAATPRGVLHVALMAPFGVVAGFVMVTSLPTPMVIGLLGVFILG
jgi:hypothetical protein